MVSAVLRTSMLQIAAPEEMRGRMQGVFIVVVAGGPRLGDLRAGALASATSVAVAMVSGGVVIVVAMAVVAVVVPSFWLFRRLPAPRSPDPSSGEGVRDHRQVGDQRVVGGGAALVGRAQDRRGVGGREHPGLVRRRPRRRRSPVAAPGRVQGSSCPRSFVIRKDGEISALAAVAPRQTTISGCEHRELRLQPRPAGPQVLGARASGGSAACPWASNRKCFTALVT